MDAIEKAVRNALEKGDAADKNYRRRVYVSARHALEKSMAGRALTQDLVDERFSRLAEVAAMIEAECALATDEIQHLTPGRRSYEAPAPHVDSYVDEGAETAELGVSQEPVETGGNVAQTVAAPVEQVAAEIWVAPDEDETISDVGVLSETYSIPDVEAPEAPVKKARKYASGGKATKRLVVTEGEKSLVSDAPTPDLFGHTEPVWDEVSIAVEPELTLHHEEDVEPAPGDLVEPEAELPLEFDPVDDPDAENIEADEFDADDLARLDGVDAVSDVAEPEPSFTADIPPLEEGSIELDPVPELSDEIVSEKHFEVRPVVTAEEKPSGIASKVETARTAANRTEPQRGMAFLFILITLLAFLVMGVWIAYSTGALKLRGSEETVPDNTVLVAPQDQPIAPAVPTQNAAPAPADDWLMIFRPDNPGDLVVDPTISANVAGTGPLAHLRIEPAASTTGEAAVVFAIGKGILEQIAGKNVVFDIVAAAADDKPTQISILCDFAGLGDCGRKRYQVDGVTSDNLFQIEFPAGKPTGDGEIILNPDVDGKGRALEIYAIKVRVSN